MFGLFFEDCLLFRFWFLQPLLIFYQTICFGWKCLFCQTCILSVNIENPPVEFTRKDWDLIDQVLSVLAPFEEATRDLSNHDASISMTIPTITIIDSLEVGDEDHGVKGLKRSLKASMEARISAVEAYEYFTIASFLDVKYKDQFFWEDETASSTKALVHWLWKNLLQLSGKMQDTG